MFGRLRDKAVLCQWWECFPSKYWAVIWWWAFAHFPMISEPSKSRLTYGPIACSQNGHKSQGPGPYRPHTSTDWCVVYSKRFLFVCLFFKSSLDVKIHFIWVCVVDLLRFLKSTCLPPPRCPGRNTTGNLLYCRFRISQVVKAVSAGSPLHPAVHRQVFYPPKALAQICIPGSQS